MRRGAAEWSVVGMKEIDSSIDLQMKAKGFLAEFKEDEPLRWYSWPRLRNIGKKESAGILSTRVGPLQHMLEHELELILSKRPIDQDKLLLWRTYYSAVIIAKNKLNKYDVDCAGAYYHLALRGFLLLGLGPSYIGEEPGEGNEDVAQKAERAGKAGDGENGPEAERAGAKESAEPEFVKLKEHLDLEDENATEEWSMTLERKTGPKEEKAEGSGGDGGPKVNQAYINKLAESTLIEGQSRLPPDDQKILEKWLFEDGKINPDLPIENLIRAQRLIHCHEEEDYFKTNLIQAQLILLAFVSFWILLGVVILLAFFDVNPAFDNLDSLLAVAFFGALGGSISGLYSFKTVDWTKNDERHIQLLNMYLTLLKPVVGATAAVIAVVFLLSGAINITIDSGESISIGLYSVLMIAFVAGFTERLITGAVGKISPEKT